MPATQSSPEKPNRKSNGRPQRAKKAELLATFHELNNVLGALGLRLDTLAADPACKPTQGKNLETCCRLFKRASVLIAEIEEQALIARPRATRRTR